MNKQEAITRLCALASQVGEDVFENTYPHDCFCSMAHDTSLNPPYYQMSEDVIEFIERAVIEAIKKTEQRKNKAQKKG